MKLNLLRSVFVASVLQAGAIAQGGWTQASISGPTPPARSQHAMAYDSVRGRAVLFGGWGGVALGDTWEWDGTGWSQVATTGPSGRYNHAMAFDSQRGCTVMFGGASWMGQGDTWEWDGTTWTQRTLTGPSGYAPYAMAYDSLRGRSVLCGSDPSNSYGIRPTFEWNGYGWLGVSSSAPGGGYAAAMAYDPVRGRTLLLGGYSGAVEFNGSTWTQVAGGPTYRPYSALTYDSNRGVSLFFGGYPNFSDTWTWSGASWAQLGYTGPAAGGMHAMVYDSQRRVAVLFANGETWEWVGNPGAASVFGNGCGNPALALSPVTNASPTINMTARVALSNAPSPLAFVAVGWSRTMAGPFPLPLSLVGYGMPGCDMLQSAEVPALATAPAGPGSSTFSLALPNLAGFVGLHLYLQGWAFAPGANVGSTIVSNGVEWTIGF